MNIEESDLPAAIEATSDLLIHFHANENHRGPIGSGHVSWEAVGRALANVGYDGCVVAEPFLRASVPPGHNVALWMAPEDEAAEDERARQSLAVLRERLRTREEELTRTH
jgi:D-psicose/D-tagatose/L-ribulose 3-epimerase